MPGLKIYTSNRLEILARQLAQIVREPLSSPFTQETIVVQSLRMERWVSMELASHNVVAQDYGMFFSNCAIFCNLGGAPLNATHAVDMVNHVTGFDYTIDDVMKIGRKVWYLKRGLTNLFGAGASEDKLPKRLMTPMTEGPSEGSVPDMDMMLKEFYEMRGLDEDGIPGKEVLTDLGLDELAELLSIKQSA